MTTNTHYYNIKSEATNAGGLRYRAIRLGQGAYAQVVLAEEVTEGPEKSTRVEIVVKIFLDVTPEDANIAFEREVELLDRLRERRNIVSVRGIERRRAPTFVCGECGVVFTVERCPECDAPLFNEGELDGGMRNRVILQCNHTDRHTFQKTDESFARLLSRRACGHTGPCDTVNFLFRPCIYLELYSVNLREYADLLARRKPSLRGHEVLTVADPTQNQDQWLRETFLMRLDCLVRIAEALEQVHRMGHVHGDIAPENIMVALSPRSDEEALQLQIPALIDFGQARRAELPRETVVIQGRHHFVAPEITGVNNAVETSAHLEPVPAEGPQSEPECELVCRAELAEGDYVWDGQGGTYEVLTCIDRHPPSRRDASAEKKGREEAIERRYRLRILSASRSPHGSGALWTNQSVRPPADVFSFGCVAAWLLTDGNEIMVQQLRNGAQFAASESQSIEEALANLRAGKTYSSLLAKIPLPRTAADDEIRDRVFETVLRCLMRIQGAYASGRSTGYERAAAKAARDLRIVHDYLYFVHRTGEKFHDFLQRDHRISFQRLDHDLTAVRKALGTASAEGSGWRQRAAELEQSSALLKREFEEARRHADDLSASLAQSEAVVERVNAEHDETKTLLEKVVAERDTLAERLGSAQSGLAAQEAQADHSARLALQEALDQMAQKFRAMMKERDELEKRGEELAGTLAMEQAERQMMSAMLEDEARNRREVEEAREKLAQQVTVLEAEFSQLETVRLDVKTTSERVLDLEDELLTKERQRLRWKRAFLGATTAVAIVVVSLSVRASAQTSSTSHLAYVARSWLPTAHVPSPPSSAQPPAADPTSAPAIEPTAAPAPEPSADPGPKSTPRPAPPSRAVPSVVPEPSPPSSAPAPAPEPAPTPPSDAYIEISPKGDSEPAGADVDKSP